jgi:hypothetical protein
MKHYHQDELLHLLRPFETISVERITVPTLTSKEAVALHYFGRKPPNPSLNTDVPHAGLRPGSGPPVSLFR